MADATDLGALDIELASDDRLEPAGDYAAGDRILLQPENRNREVVEDVAGFELEVVERVDGDMKLVDLRDVVSRTLHVVRAGVDESPSPLLPDHANFRFHLGKILLHVVPDLDGHHDDHEVEGEDRDMRPVDPLHVLVLGARDVHRLLALLRLEAKDEREEEVTGDRERDPDQERNDIEERIDVPCVGRGRGRKQ